MQVLRRPVETTAKKGHFDMKTPKAASRNEAALEKKMTFALPLAAGDEKLTLD